MAAALEASVSKSGSAALAEGLREGASRRRAGRPAVASDVEARRPRGERDRAADEESLAKDK